MPADKICKLTLRRREDDDELMSEMSLSVKKKIIEKRKEENTRGADENFCMQCQQMHEALASLIGPGEMS